MTNKFSNNSENEIAVGSGNVFADLGLDNPEELSLKAALAIQISTIIEKSHMTQAQAGTVLGIPQSKVSNIMNGKLAGFSADKLLCMMQMLGRDVEIVIKKKRSGSARGRMSLTTPTKKVPIAQAA